MRRRVHSIPQRVESNELVERARRLRRRGERRKALQVLRLACCDDSENASLWGQYGFRAWLEGKQNDAAESLQRAAWLFERQHEPRRAAAIRRLLSRIDAGARAA